MAVSEEMLLLEEWLREQKRCLRFRGGWCADWTVKTECKPANCPRLDVHERKVLVLVESA